MHVCTYIKHSVGVRQRPSPPLVLVCCVAGKCGGRVSLFIPSAPNETLAVRFFCFVLFVVSSRRGIWNMDDGMVGWWGDGLFWYLV